jgi:hypothetical protein
MLRAQTMRLPSLLVGEGGPKGRQRGWMPGLATPLRSLRDTLSHEGRGEKLQEFASTVERRSATNSITPYSTIALMVTGLELANLRMNLSMACSAFKERCATLTSAHDGAMTAAVAALSHSAPRLSGYANQDRNAQAPCRRSAG